MIRIDPHRLNNPSIRRFLAVLDRISDRDTCPPEVTAILAEWLRSNSEFASSALYFLGRPLSALSPSDDFWETNEASYGMAMPQDALLYYLPIFLKQAVLVPSSMIGIDVILAGFVPPAKTQERPERRKKYVRQLTSNWPIDHLVGINELILLVLKEPVLFEYEQASARKCYDRFWLEVESIGDLGAYLAAVLEEETSS